MNLGLNTYTGIPIPGINESVSKAKPVATHTYPLMGLNGYAPGDLTVDFSANSGKSSGCVSKFQGDSGQDIRNQTQFQWNYQTVSEINDSLTSPQQRVAEAVVSPEAVQRHGVNGSTLVTSNNIQGQEDADEALGLRYKSYSEMIENKKKHPIFTCPKLDPSITTSGDAKRKLVRELVDIIQANTVTLDRPNADSFVSRWASDAGYYDPIDFEEMAWDIVGKTTDLHLNGWTERINDKRLMKEILKTQYWSFAERLDYIKKLLRVRIRAPRWILSTNRPVGGKEYLCIASKE
jgi:hypothetical protein